MPRKNRKRIVKIRQDANIHPRTCRICGRIAVRGSLCQSCSQFIKEQKSIEKGTC